MLAGVSVQHATSLAQCTACRLYVLVYGTYRACGLQLKKQLGSSANCVFCTVHVATVTYTVPHQRSSQSVPKVPQTTPNQCVNRLVSGQTRHLHSDWSASQDVGRVPPSPSLVWCVPKQRAQQMAHVLKSYGNTPEQLIAATLRALPSIRLHYCSVAKHAAAALISCLLAQHAAQSASCNSPVLCTYSCARTLTSQELITPEKRDTQANINFSTRFVLCRPHTRFNSLILLYARACKC